MFERRELIELLDRRYDLIADLSNSGEFLLELNRFLEFIQSDSRLRFYTEQMEEESQRLIQERDRVFEEQEQEAIKLRDRLAEICPDLDDSDMLFEAVPETELGPSGRPTMRYLSSLAHFDDVVKGTDRWPAGLRVWGMGKGNRYEDHSKVKELLRILSEKLYSETCRGCSEADENTSSCQALWSDLYYLQDKHLHTHRDFVNRSRVSPEVSLVILKDVLRSINPPPTRPETSFDLLDQAIESIVTPQGKDQATIEKVVYQGESIDLSVCRSLFRRIYEQLRELIGSQLAFLQVVERYKVRCEVYDQLDLVQQIEDYIKDREEERKRVQLEDRLTRHLALYLYDNGYPVYYRLRAAGQEPDLLSGPNVQDPFAVEAKVVGRGRGKEWIWEGLRALHSYLERCYSEYGTTNGCLIVFRVGEGEMFSFIPREWQVGHFVIIPRLINLGGTSKIAEPVMIRQEDWETS